MKTMATLAGALLTATLAAAPATAAIVTATYTGTVFYGDDSTGVFHVRGSLGGLSMVSSFVYDTNGGNRTTSSVADYVIGGVHFPSSSPLISASVTIGGVTQTTYDPNYFGLAEVRGGTIAEQEADAESSFSIADINYTFSTYFTSFVQNAVVPARIDTSFTLPSTGASFGQQSAQILDSYSITGGPSGTVQQAIANGTVDSLTVVATGVPEPATWALLIAGFGAVGVAARRHRPVAA